MKFFFPGLIIGAIASLFLLTPTAGTEIDPEWHGGLRAIPAIEPSPRKSSTPVRFFVKNKDTEFYLLGGNGAVVQSGSIEDGLIAFSGDGQFYVRFQKVGSEIEFFNVKGDRFWKIESMEYPYLSHNGKLIMLLNGDQSGIRFVDNNGNGIGAGPVSGRTCTAIAFPDHGDFGAAGFLDGTYFAVNARGKIIARGAAPRGNIVKGVAVSGNGAYTLVHYGNTQKDSIRIIENASGGQEELELKYVHPVKTSLYITDGGNGVVLDTDRILYVSGSGRVRFSIDIPPKRDGHSSISYQDGIFAAAYTMRNGSSKLLLFRDDGIVLFSREFPAESFLDAVVRNGLVLLRGSDNLFCYRISRPSR